MSRIKKANSVLGLGFRVHSPNLLQDIITHALLQNSGMIKFPLNEFQRWLIVLAERCIEINDPELNIIMLSMTLYDVDPRDITAQIENQMLLMQKGDGKVYDLEDMRNCWKAAHSDALMSDEEDYKPLFFEEFITSVK